MTDEEAHELGKRAVACSGWRWMPGMRCSPFVPDLRDPATLGCLLALVREAWGDPTIHLTCVDSLEAGQYDWIVRSVADKWSSDLLIDSEAEALVAALEAAP